jgi:hypothetical protein
VEAERERRSHLTEEERNREFRKIARTPVDDELDRDEHYVKAMLENEEIMQRIKERRQQEEEAEKERIRQMEIQRIQEEEHCKKEEERKLEEERRKLQKAEENRLEEEKRAHRKKEWEKEENARMERIRVSEEMGDAQTCVD